MSDKVKLIIEIPKVFYESLKETDVFISGQRSGKTLMSVVYNAVAKAVPLDYVKDEMECMTFSDSEGHAYIYLPHAFKILDNIGDAESKDERKKKLECLLKAVRNAQIEDIREREENE